MTKIYSSLESVDVRHLYYFLTVAKERNIRRAAEKLFMAQPPLSRHIKLLEERLGVRLFERHSKGLTLTEQGEKVLEIIAPLLTMKDTTFLRLKNEVKREEKTLRIGFTTAFEQGIFIHLEASLHAIYGKKLRIVREPSIKLTKEVRRGKLDVAIVALPLEVTDLYLYEMEYKEPLVAALPSKWQVPKQKQREKVENSISIKDLASKPLFWFKREANPDFFDFTKRRFTQFSYYPPLLEEPLEHDVFLARIAFGEGMGLFAKSFASITRAGVTFCDIKEKEELYIQAGILMQQENKELIRTIKETFRV